jgi:protein-lysine N-methyltransferase EEF2KMT
MNHLSTLLSSPLPSEAISAQQKSYVTYTLSSLIPTSSNEQVPKPRPGATPEITPPTTPTFTTPIPPTITLLESRNLVAASGTTGLRTWEASLHLSSHLLSNPSLIASKSILELGAGTGYLSILCSKHLSASHVLATDGSEDVVSTLSTNFFLNGLKDEEKIEGEVLKWGQKVDGGRRVDVDVVLGADVTYDAAGIPALVATFRELFGLFPGVRVLIAATVRNQDTFETFVRTCRGNGLGVEEIGFPMVRGEEQEGPFYEDRVPIKLCFVRRG